MTPERWQHLKALLHSALELKPDERAAFLAEACGDDVALREELQSLLAHDEQAGSFIEQPAFGVMAETLTNKQATTMVGRTLGRYRIIAALGSGGMGEVYLAEDTQLGRKIALKILPAHFTLDDERVRRFQQEARAASALNHPNIITIYEIGQIDSHHFIVTEFIEGETLRQRMAKTQVAIAEALDVAAQVASALATAHQAGIVHRDIKPENVMLRADGIAKVLDFGLVKLTERKNVTADSPTLFETAPGMVMGTAHYMSPEQARGLPVDARTDIWSLGVVLFEMVGGRVPFEGATSSDVIASILEREPTNLARYAPEVPTELEWIVKKALRKDREERHQTARELLTDLRSLKHKLEFEEQLQRSRESGERIENMAPKSRSHSSKPKRQSYEGVPHNVIDSLAILPLINQCTNPGMEYLSDGISESMISALSQLSELRVMAWSTVSHYKGKEVDPRESGRELGVRAVITGRVMQLGERLVIKTELVDAADGSHLWGESYSCKLSEILDIEEEIANSISDKLRLRLTTAEKHHLTKLYPENVEAYHAYLKGRYFWNKRTEEGVKSAIEHFKNAIDADPSYALAYSGLADAYLILGGTGIGALSPREAFPKAHEAATRALEIDGTLAEAHASLAYGLTNYYWDWSTAEREFKRSLELNPDYATARHWYAFLYLTAMGQLDEAIAEEERAHELEPLSLAISTDLGLIYYVARQYDQAIRQYQKTLEMDPDFVYTRWQLALAYEQKGMYTEAIAEFQKAIKLSGTSALTTALLGHAYAVSGNITEALKVLDELRELSLRRYVSPYRVAAIYVGLGEQDQAYEWLERAYEERDGWLIWLNSDPVLDDLRTDQRFRNLVRRMGLLPVETSQMPTLSEETKLPTKRHTASSEAYRAYLKGRYHWNRRIEDGFKKAIDYFNQAVEKDPTYAQAYAGLADCYALLSWYSVLPPKDSFPQAKAAALKALELDDTLAEAHTSLAFIKQSFDWDWSGADLEYKRALELDPGYATARQWYALSLSARGWHQEAIAEIEYAEELDPLSLVINRDGGWVCYWARQYDRAVAYYQKTFELEPHFYIAHYFLGEVYQQKGDYQKAIAEFHQTRTHPEWTTKIWTLIAHARAHALKVERREAQQKIDELKSLSKQHYVSPYLIAVVYVTLGERDEAFEWLEKAFEERDPYLTYLKVEPALDPLRSDPRFQDLVHRMGLPLSTTSPPLTLSSAEQRRETTKEQTASSGGSSSQSWWRRREAKVSLALGVVLLLAGGWYLWPRLPGGTKQSPTLRNATFIQLTDQPGPEFFPSLSPDARSLAYASRASGNWDIYLQSVGERNQINLTKDSLADDTQPAFSPNGDRIAFRSERDGGGIFLMGAFGESVTRISNFGYSPAWSPDGQQIVVGTEKIPQPSTRPSKSQLWAINTRTNERRLITEGDALQPNSSPHGNRIAFWSRPSKTGQRDSVWTIPAEGGDAVAVTDGKTTDSNPVWSPDGKLLYFSSNRGGSVNIWRVPIDEKSGAVLGQAEAVTTIGAATSALHVSFARDGRRLAYIAQGEIRNLRKISFDPSSGKGTSEPVSITRGSMQLWFPDASPDGEWLTCYSMGNQGHIFIMRTDGSELRDLTDDAFRHFWPRWSPDGKRIAFSSRRSGSYEIWAINPDGSGLQQLTSGHQSPGAHYSPWSPDSKRIAYTIHVPKHECIIFEPGKTWNEQKLEYLPPLSDASLSFEGWSWSKDGKKLAGIRHLPSGVHSGIGVYDQESRNYDWLTDFGDWPVWLDDNRHLLFVSQGKILLFDTATRKYEPVLTVTDQDVDIGSPALSPDNRTIYFTYVAAEADIWLMTLD